MKAIGPGGARPAAVVLRDRVALGELWCSRCDPFELVRVVDALVRDRELGPRTITFLNAHVYCLAYGERDGGNCRSVLRTAGVVAADGVSMALASWVLQAEWPARCMMTRAFDEYVRSSTVADARALLAGATAAEVAAAADAINRQSPHLRVVRALSGYLAPAEYRGACEADGGVDLVLLGMGSPRTEGVMRRLSEQCPSVVAWHIGAGTIKCCAGTKRRAARLVQDVGLEWMHRLWFEPHTRKRYLLGIPRFLWLLTRIRLARSPTPRPVPGLGGPGG